MAVRINDIAPDFTAESTAGTIRFHDWLGDSYAIIFSHPRDFTPVCTTEFGAVAQLADEWKKRKTKVIGVSVDSVQDHEKWKRDIEAVGDALADRARKLAFTRDVGRRGNIGDHRRCQYLRHVGSADRGGVNQQCQRADGSPSRLSSHGWVIS